MTEYSVRYLTTAPHGHPRLAAPRGCGACAASGSMRYTEDVRPKSARTPAGSVGARCHAPGRRDRRRRGWRDDGEEKHRMEPTRDDHDTSAVDASNPAATSP